MSDRRRARRLEVLIEQLEAETDHERAQRRWHGGQADRDLTFASVR